MTLRQFEAYGSKLESLLVNLLVDALYFHEIKSNNCSYHIRKITLESEVWNRAPTATTYTQKLETISYYAMTR